MEFQRLPAEVLVEICRHLVVPMHSSRHGHGPVIRPETEEALACRAALARLMRTCRNLHDVAGCVLYSGYYQLWHPSAAYRFLRTLDPHSHEPCYDTTTKRPPDLLSFDGTRRHIVRHLDIHTNLDRRTLNSVPWTGQQGSIMNGTWIETMASRLGMPFPEGWHTARHSGDENTGDHAAEHLNQLLLRYLSDLTSVNITLVFNWDFDVLEKWINEQQETEQQQTEDDEEVEPFAPFRNLRHLKVHLRCLEARSFNCLKVIIKSAPYLSTLEIYDSISYRPQLHSRLEALRVLKFDQCAMDRNAMRFTLTAVPNITRFEYRHSNSSLIVGKHPALTPRMLRHLLSNEYELTRPAPLNARGQLAKAVLPDLHLQLRALVIAFPVYEGMRPWGDDETIDSLRHFAKLRSLSIDSDSIACTSPPEPRHMTISNLEDMVPETLEALEITRVGGYFRELVETSLPSMARAVSKGRFGRLRRIDLLGCPDVKEVRNDVQLHLHRVFERRLGPMISVTILGEED
ncbi:Putative leucine-rich repeat domain superfamily [Colletotrichum destructivum]|uniref:Leucine-rich repeat domain superfamily n=1 Tax=Colletotrichum destructivum TaxID=34406 RepID=A0AAX4HWT8_9PEZI|nr:Putative leucine-rich repeat domain superfamily [Colletotrichum destructivum]